MLAKVVKSTDDLDPKIIVRKSRINQLSSFRVANIKHANGHTSSSNIKWTKDLENIFDVHVLHTYILPERLFMKPERYDRLLQLLNEFRGVFCSWIECKEARRIIFTALLLSQVACDNPDIKINVE